MRLDSEATAIISESHGPVNEALRAQYQEAVRANVAAKRHYDEVASQRLPMLKDLDYRYSTRGVLNQRLELLEQQNHHAKLIAMKDQLEAINISSLAAVNVNSRTDEIWKGPVHSKTGLEELASSISSSIQALELALVQAHHEARRDKTAVDGLKASISDQFPATAQQRSHAMLAVRKELTAWLEQNLNQCQEDDTGRDRDDKLSEENDDRDWEVKIDSQYEQYLGTRRTLLNTVAELKRPLPSPQPSAANGEKASQETGSRSLASSKLADIENSLFSGMKQESMLQAYSTFATEQLRKDVATTTNLLDRLSDESQLLQTFPLLYRSEGFEKARSVFRQTGSGTSSEDNDEIMKRLEPWLFAVEAADVASTDATEKHLQQANEAMETVSQGLLELQLLRETRQ